MDRTERIDWCDIFKGIVIILVVVGHATSRFDQFMVGHATTRFNQLVAGHSVSRFNQYIYQFHMAAFFFISGYTGKGRNSRDSVFAEICKKFYKLMIPYYVINFMGISLFWLFDQAGILSKVSTIQYPERFQTALLGLFQDTVYCDWLGAMWFLPVLFWAAVIFRILISLCRKDVVLCLVSILVFWCGMRLSVSGVPCHFLDLAGRAQLFLVGGYLARKIKDGRNSVWLLAVKIGLIGAAWWGSVHLGFNYIVDWPSRFFNGFIDIVLPVFGILMTISMARLLEKSGVLKRILVCLGQNSMGIMCFHFIGFKAAYLLLVLLGRMDVSEVYRLIPEQMAERWWLLVSVVAIVVSVLLWRWMNKVSVVRLLIGGESAGKIYGRLLETSVVSGVKDVCDCVADSLRDALTEYKNYLEKQKYIKAFIAVCVVAAGVGGIAVKVCRYHGEIEVIFPYSENIVTLGDGWLPQSPAEDYRWLEKRAELKVFLTGQKRLEIKGYIPDTIENISYIAVAINGIVVYKESADAGSLVEICLDITEDIENYRINTFEIETDGVRVPAETDADQRKLSLLVNSITFD